MESPDALQEIESIRLGIDFDGGCGPVRHFRRPQTKLIGHGNTKITKQRLGKAAQALLPWNSNISVMVEFQDISTNHCGRSNQSLNGFAYRLVECKGGNPFSSHTYCHTNYCVQETEQRLLPSVYRIV